MAYVKQKLEPRKCAYNQCRIKFLPNRKWQRYCCDSHRFMAWKEANMNPGKEI